MGYLVVSTNRDGDEVVESHRTDKRAAEDDVSLLRGICRKKVTYYEVPDIYQREKR